jgi:hypothetical protein
MVNLFYDQSTSIYNIYNTILCNDLSMPMLSITDSEFGNFVCLVMRREKEEYWVLMNRMVEKGDYEAKRVLLSLCFPRLTNGERRYFVHWVLEKGDQDAKSLLLKICSSELADEERRSLVHLVARQGEGRRSLVDLVTRQEFHGKSIVLKYFFLDLTDEDRRLVVHWAMEEKCYSMIPNLVKYFSDLTNEERLSLVCWVMEATDNSVKELFFKECFPNRTNEELQSLVHYLVDGKHINDALCTWFRKGFIRLTAEKQRTLVHWMMEDGKYITCNAKTLLLKACFSKLTNEERWSLVHSVIESGFFDYDCKVLLLNDKYFLHLTDLHRRSLVHWGIEDFFSRGDRWSFSDKSLLLRNGFPYLTDDECKRLVDFCLRRDGYLVVLESCFSKLTPEQFNLIIERIREPLFNLSSGGFCKVIGQADPILVLLFLENYFSRRIVHKLSPEPFRQLVNKADLTGVLRLLETYLPKLTDEQFAVMIERADTMWAEEFLKRHPQLPIQRSSMVRARCSPPCTANQLQVN